MRIKENKPIDKPIIARILAFEEKLLLEMSVKNLRTQYEAATIEKSIESNKQKNIQKEEIKERYGRSTQLRSKMLTLQSTHQNLYKVQ